MKYPIKMAISALTITLVLNGCGSNESNNSTSGTTTSKNVVVNGVTPLSDITSTNTTSKQCSPKTDTKPKCGCPSKKKSTTCPKKEIKKKCGCPKKEDTRKEKECNKDSTKAQQGIALLGNLSDALVQIYEVDSDGSLIFKWEDRTTTGGSLSEMGRFPLHNLELDADKYYIYKVIGGFDWDADDDGIMDSNPTSNLGTIRAIAKGSDILKVGGKFKVTAVSELVYEKVEKALNGDINPANLDNFLSQSAKDYIYDINQDGEVNYLDILEFSPSKNKDDLKIPLKGEIEQIYKLIHSGKSIIGNLNPVVGWIDLDKGAYFIKLLPDGTKAFATDNQWEGSSFYTLDLSNPTSPKLLSTINEEAKEYGYNTVNISSDNKKVFIENLYGWYNMKVYGILDSSNPKYLGTINKGVVEINSNGDIAYYIEDQSLNIYDISDIDNKQLISSIKIPNLGGDIGVQLSKDGSKLYIANVDYSNAMALKLAIIDIQKPQQPIILSNKIVVAHIIAPEDSLRVVLSKDGKKLYTFLQHEEYYMQIIDVSDPLNPTSLVQDQNQKVNFKGSLYAYDILSNDNALYNIYNNLEFYKLDESYNQILLGQVGNENNYYTDIYGQFIGLSKDYKKIYFIKDGVLNAIDIKTQENVSLTSGNGILFARDITLSNDGKFAYIPTKTGIKVLDLTLF